MAITAGSRIFVDTNILVYAELSQSPFHDKAVAHLREFEKTGTHLYISRQVLREVKNGDIHDKYCQGENGDFPLTTK